MLDRGGDVVGYLYGEVLEHTGYVRNLVVAPEARGHGLGRRLMTSFAERLRRAGLSRWELNVKPDNAPAIALYEGLGMRRRYGSAALHLDWPRADALPRAAVDVGEVAPGAEGEIETALGVMPGLLARGRAQGRYVLAGRDARGHPVGVALFDPGFPGAFPFRAAGPGVAGALLHGLRPLARHDFLLLTIEDDEPLVEHLLAAGAALRLRVVHYAGAL